MHRRDENRPLDEHDFDTVKLFADCGLHWAGFQTWFGRPREEIKRYVFDAWPDLFARVEASDRREEARKAAYGKITGNPLG